MFYVLFKNNKIIFWVIIFYILLTVRVFSQIDPYITEEEILLKYQDFFEDEENQQEEEEQEEEEEEEERIIDHFKEQKFDISFQINYLTISGDEKILVYQENPYIKSELLLDYKKIPLIGILINISQDNVLFKTIQIEYKNNIKQKKDGNLFGEIQYSGWNSSQENKILSYLSDLYVQRMNLFSIQFLTQRRKNMWIQVGYKLESISFKDNIRAYKTFNNGILTNECSVREECLIYRQYRVDFMEKNTLEIKKNQHIGYVGFNMDFKYSRVNLFLKTIYSPIMFTNIKIRQTYEDPTTLIEDNLDDVYYIGYSYQGTTGTRKSEQKYRFSSRYHLGVGSKIDLIKNKLGLSIFYEYKRDRISKGDRISEYYPQKIQKKCKKCVEYSNKNQLIQGEIEYFF